jgi:hypothetical protein
MNPTKLSGPRPPAAFLAANCDIKLKVVEAASSLLAVADHKEKTKFHSVADLHAGCQFGESLYLESGQLYLTTAGLSTMMRARPAAT